MRRWAAARRTRAPHSTEFVTTHRPPTSPDSPVITPETAPAAAADGGVDAAATVAVLKPWNRLTKRLGWFDLRAASLWVILLILMLTLSIASPYFLTGTNLLNVSQQISINAIIAIGMTVVIVAGGIDLSVGGIVGVAGTASAVVVGSTGSVPLAFATAIAVGLAIGSLNGFFVSYVGLIPFVVTLAMLSITQSINLIWTNGSPLVLTSGAYNSIGQGYIGPIPTPVVIMAVLYVVASVLLRQTPAGQYVYAIGGNSYAARVSGINVRRNRFMHYVVIGLLCGVAALILTARLGSAQPDAGTNYELNAITAVILGGTSLYGGRGTLMGTLIGCFIIGFISNGLDLLNVNPLYQGLVDGAILLVAVSIDRVFARRTPL